MWQPKKKPIYQDINPLIRVFITSDIFLWSAWNFVIPIFAVFVTENVPGGNLEIAATAYSAFLLTRVFFELASGKYMEKADKRTKLLFAVLGIVISSISYVGFAYTKSVFFIYFFYILNGIGLGISTPPKNTLFSSNLDRGKETSEWWMYDASTYISMAVSASVGGIIANQLSFQTLFLISAFLSLFSTLPYIHYLKHYPKYKLNPFIK